MRKAAESISANEINKYLYCPYQWYYERLHGAAEIRKLYKERNHELGLEDVAYSNFRKGIAFHSSHDFGSERSSALRWLMRIAVIIAILAGVLCGYLFYHYFI